MRRNRRFSLGNTKGQSPTYPPGEKGNRKSIMVLELQNRL